MVKVRFAPSPTGLLHVGNVRVALLNYFFTKKNNGKFVLRIDDTDMERSSKELENIIIEDLKWLGINWDEFYRQSERFDRYAQNFEKLKNEGRIYKCFESRETLALMRKTQAASGKPPVYNRAALKLTEQEIKEREKNGEKPYWRFKLNDQTKAEWADLVHGKIEVPLNTVSDPIIIKPDGSYVYTFSSVIDDIDMGITHIIRGDDHVTNTAVQIDMFQAIAGHQPEFAHIPLMSSLDGQEVSKRTGSPLSIINMRNDGIFPEAIIGVLATIGTSESAKCGKTLQDFIQDFDFKKISKSAVKFNIEDIRNLNKKVLSEKTFDEVKEELKKLNLGNLSEGFWETIKNNLVSLKDAAFWYEILLNKIEIVKQDEKFVRQMLDTLKNPINFDEWIENLKNISGQKGKNLYHPMRLVLTGVENGPELKKIVAFLGYEKVKERIENNLNF